MSGSSGGTIPPIRPALPTRARSKVLAQLIWPSVRTLDVRTLAIGLGLTIAPLLYIAFSSGTSPAQAVIVVRASGLLLAIALAGIFEEGLDVELLLSYPLPYRYFAVSRMLVGVPVVTLTVAFQGTLLRTIAYRHSTTLPAEWLAVEVVTLTVLTWGIAVNVPGRSVPHGVIAALAISTLSGVSALADKGVTWWLEPAEFQIASIRTHAKWLGMCGLGIAAIAVRTARGR